MVRAVGVLKDDLRQLQGFQGLVEDMGTALELLDLEVSVFLCVLCVIVIVCVIICDCVCDYMWCVIVCFLWCGVVLCGVRLCV